MRVDLLWQKGSDRISSTPARTQHQNPTFWTSAAELQRCYTHAKCKSSHHASAFPNALLRYLFKNCLLLLIYCVNSFISHTHSAVRFLFYEAQCAETYRTAKKVFKEIHDLPWSTSFEPLNPSSAIINLKTFSITMWGSSRMMLWRNVYRYMGTRQSLAT